MELVPESILDCLEIRVPINPSGFLYVNKPHTTSRKGSYFHAAVSVSNTATNASQAITIGATQPPASASSNGNIKGSSPHKQCFGVDSIGLSVPGFLRWQEN